MKLSLSWEAVQDFYTTYANIVAYKDGIKKFCSFGEKTYLIKMSNKKIQAFLDEKESEQSAELGLKDFLSEKWRFTFRNKSLKAIDEAKRFVKKYHLDVPKKKSQLFRTIKKGTTILNDLFTVFVACNPQYTAKVQDYLLSFVTDDVIDALIIPSQITPLMEEEIAWHNLLTKLKKKNKNPPKNVPQLELHAKRYGLLRSADGLKPWNKKSLHKRLKKDWNTELKSSKIQSHKNKILKKHQIPREVVVLCKAIAEFGNIRLSLRVEGWMPIAYVLSKELLPAATHYLPYTSTQLENCRHTELFDILDGKALISPKELNVRNKLVMYGLLSGKEVLWNGKEAELKIKEMIPSEKMHAKKIKGQIGMKGHVTGKCYVIKWHSKNLSSDIDNMPKGAVLVAGQTRPNLLPAIKKASAIVTDEGGILSHAAIVSRELKIPCVIGTKIATKILKNGDLVEVDANKGIVKILRR